MTSQLARQFCPQPQHKGSVKENGLDTQSINKGNVLIKQTMWNYEDFVNPEVYDPPKKCFYKIMTKEDFITHEKLFYQLSGEQGKELEKKEGSVCQKMQLSEESMATTASYCYCVRSPPEENLCGQKNSRLNNKIASPVTQIQQQMSECQQKQRRFLPNRVPTNEGDKCSIQQAIAQTPSQQRANPRTKPIPSSLCSAMNFQPRPGPGCVAQSSPPAEACNKFNAFIPANANVKAKCPAQPQRCPLSQSPPPQRCLSQYPQSQPSPPPPPPPPPQNTCVKNHSRSPSPLSRTSSRPCTASSASTVVGCPNVSQAGPDCQTQGYGAVASSRPSQTSGQCNIKQQLQSSVSQPSACPPHNYNTRPPQMPRGRQNQNVGYNCSMGNRPLQLAHQPGSMVGKMPQVSPRRSNQCASMPPANFQYEGQSSQHQVEPQQFNLSPNAGMGGMPPNEPITVNGINQPCPGPPQSGFNQCGNLYEKSGNSVVRQNLRQNRSGSGRVCRQYSTGGAATSAERGCDHPGQSWNGNGNVNVQQDCYTSDTDNCDADGDNRFDDTSGYPTGDEYNCECFSDTADEYCANGDGGNMTDDDQNCDMGFDEDCNMNGCNQNNNCSFQVQDYGHSNKEECQCGNSSPKACIPDCSDNKVQVVIQIPQNLGRQQDERKQEDDFECVPKHLQGRHALMPPSNNTQTTQTSTTAESRHDSIDLPATAAPAPTPSATPSVTAAACIALCPEPVTLDKTCQQVNLPIILMPQPQKKSDCETEISNIKPDEELNTNDIKIYYNPQTFNIQSFIESVQTSKLIYYPPPQSFDPMPPCPSVETTSASVALSQPPNPCALLSQNNASC